MTIVQPAPPPTRFSQRSLSVQSPYAFEWRASAPNPATAVTGQVVTTAGTASVSVTASNSLAYTVTRNRVARDFRQKVGVWTQAGRTLSAPYPVTPGDIQSAVRALFVHEFVERGAAEVSGARIWQVGEGATTARVLAVRSVIGTYVASIGNGSASVEVALGFTGAVGDLIRHEIEVEFSGANVRLKGAGYLNGESVADLVTSGWLDGSALVASGWAGANTAFIGSRDSAADAGTTAHCLAFTDMAAAITVPSPVTVDFGVVNSGAYLSIAEGATAFPMVDSGTYLSLASSGTIAADFVRVGAGAIYLRPV